MALAGEAQDRQALDHNAISKDAQLVLDILLLNKVMINFNVLCKP